MLLVLLVLTTTAKFAAFLPPQEPFVVRREHPLMVIDVQLVQQS
jgi:hypothetical protein